MRTAVFWSDATGGLRFQGNQHGTPEYVANAQRRRHPDADGVEVRTNGDVVVTFADH